MLMNILRVKGVHVSCSMIRWLIKDSMSVKLNIISIAPFWQRISVLSYKSFSLSNVSPYVTCHIIAYIEQEMIHTSVKAFLSATLALCKRRITFLAPSTTAASIRKRCRSSSTLSSSASSKLGSYLSVIRMFDIIVHATNIPFIEISDRTIIIKILTRFEWRVHSNIHFPSGE